MKPFEQLSTRGQTSRLRALAEAALTCYDLHDAHIALLSHRENTMFRVTLPPQGNSSGNASKDTTSGGKFVLRLYGRQVPRVAMIQSELLWLEALRRETELDVPEPVPGRDGSLVTEVVSAEVPGPRLCVLFRWVEGRFIHTALTPAQIERVGMFMARLHRHSTQFVPPPTFVRPHWEWTEVLGKGTVVDPAFVAEKGNGLISPKSSALFSAVAERVRMEMQAIPQNADYYGLIHGDFQHTNYLFYRGKVRLIDFGDCCWGYYLYDMAKTLAPFDIETSSDHAAKMRHALFTGYERIRRLPPAHERGLKVFTALRLIGRMNYLLRSELPSIRAQASEWIPRFTHWLDRFVGQ